MTAQPIQASSTEARYAHGRRLAVLAELRDAGLEEARRMMTDLLPDDAGSPLSQPDRNRIAG